MWKYEGRVQGQNGGHYIELTHVRCPVCNEIMKILPNGCHQIGEKHDFFFDRVGRERYIAAIKEEDSFNVTLKCPECSTELTTDIDIVDIKWE